MKKLFISLLIIFAASVAGSAGLSAQDCYSSTRQQGISCYNDGDYSIAIDCFEAAKLCPDKPSGDDLDAWISKCRTRLKEAKEAAMEAEARRKEQEEAAAERRREQEEAAAERRRKEWEDKAYMDIQSVYFKSEGKMVSSLTQANSIKYLTPVIKYDGMGEETVSGIEIFVKIIQPDGSLSSGTSSPSGYTYSSKISVHPLPDQEQQLSGWGTANGGYYSPGIYKIELWYKGTMIFSRDFTLSGTKKATTLTVDRKTALSVSLDANGGYYSFAVSTDGDSYDVDLLPSWCSLSSKTKTVFTIKYTANNTSSVRRDWFKVTSGTKSVRIDISQQSSGPSAEITNIWVDHNYYNNYQYGMLIHIHMVVHDMKDKDGNVVAYFYYGSGSESQLIDYNGSYRTQDGKVAVGESFTSIYEHCEWKDYKLFIPYSELHVGKGMTELKFQVQVFGDRDQLLTESGWQYFTVSF